MAKTKIKVSGFCLMTDGAEELINVSHSAISKAKKGFVVVTVQDTARMRQAIKSRKELELVKEQEPKEDTGKKAGV